jgi:hypothetical protein
MSLVLSFGPWSASPPKLTPPPPQIQTNVVNTYVTTPTSDTPDPCYSELMLPASSASPQTSTGIIDECQDCFARFLPELADSAPGSAQPAPVVTLNLHISLPLPDHCFLIHLHLRTIYCCTRWLLILQLLIVYSHCSFLPSPQLLITHYCAGSGKQDRN